MIGSLHFWLRLSLCALTLRGLWSIIGLIVARRDMTGENTHGIRAVGKLISPLAVAVFWFAGGCAFMNYEFNQTVKTKKDVLILARKSDSHFQAFTPTNGNGKFELVTCSPADFQPGEKLIFLTYEFQNGCSNIRGTGRGFKAYTDKNGNRIIFPIQQEIANVR